MSLGKLVYKYLYAPTASIRYNLHHFGIKGWHAYKNGEKQMKVAAVNFPAINLQTADDVPVISYLTGEKYWHQTIFGIQSLVNHYGNNIGIDIYSDGSLTPPIIDTLKNYCPQIAIITEEQIMANLNAIIPADKYPSLHFLRSWSAFFKRMIDIHCKMQWAIHLDSDMLFFKYPDDLTDFSKQKKAFFMQEQMNASYFVDDSEVLLKKYDIPTLQNVNGGIIAYDGSVVDYQRLEHIAKLLLENYFHQGPARIEQTLMSYILAMQNGTPLNKTDYKIYYDSAVDDNDNATLRHYIFKAKLPYFSAEWKTISH
jgi:hypothetical protein